MKNRILSVILAVLCFLTIIPFAAVADNGEDFAPAYDVYQYHEHNMNVAFENPYHADGNYKQYGYVFTKNVEKDGVTCVEVSRDPEIEDIYAYRESDDSTVHGTYATNFYAYNDIRGKDNELISIYGGRYLVFEYYYDTTGREEVEDESFTEIDGRSLSYVAYGMGNIAVGPNNKISCSVSVSEEIVTDEWVTVVFDLGAAYAEQAAAQFAAPDGWNEEEDGVNPNNWLDPANDMKRGLWQYAFYPFGTGYFDMHKGDKYYFKPVITYASYDPTEFDPATECDEVLVEVDGYDSEFLPVMSEFVVPAYNGVLGEGESFVGWVESYTNITYQPGDVIVLNKGGISQGQIFVNDYWLIPVIDVPNTVNFMVGDEVVHTEKWFLDSTNTLPAGVEAPEGMVFSGWSDGTTTYKAGASYTYTDEEVVFTAVFVEPGVYYLSADGVIDGVDDTVYTTFADAIAAVEGAGVIYVEGDINVNATYTFDCESVKIVSYDPENPARLIYNTNEGTAIFASNSETSVLYDDITIVRANTSGDEIYNRLQGVELTIGKNVGFVGGKRTTNNSDLFLYFGNNGGAKPASLIVNSAAVRFAHLAPIGGWGNSSTVNGDFYYELNAGTYGEVYAVSRNGNSGSAHGTVNGSVEMIVNGGDFTGKFGVGSSYQSHVIGDVIVTVNGGTFANGIVFGDSGKFTSSTTPSNVGGTLALIVNAGEMSTVPAITKGGSTLGIKGNTLLVVNNVEKYDADIPDVGATTSVKVTNGVATPIINGTNVKYTIVPDDDSYDQVLANGVVIEPVDGYYTLPEGDVSVTFGIEGMQTYSLSYDNNGTIEKIGDFYEGNEVVLPAVAGENGLILDYYLDGETQYVPGSKYTIGTENVVLDLVWYENNENIWYVASTGSTSASGHRETVPFKTIQQALAAIGSEDGTVVLMDMINLGVYDFALAAGQTIRITGEGYENAGFANGKHRANVTGGGHLILDNLIDYNNETGDTNTPWRVGGNTELTIGEGYRLAVLSNGAMAVGRTGTQVEVAGNVTGNVKVNIDGDAQFVTIIDWNNVTVDGDYIVNIGPNAHFSKAQGSAVVAVGGDAAAAGNNAVVNGKVYITVDGTDYEGGMVYRNGFKAGANTTINGIQVLLKNTNVGYGDHTTYGTYTNNGSEFVVKATTIDGSDVTLPEFGKATITLGNEMEAIIEDANGKRTITETTTIDLAEGTTVIQCASNAMVTITDGNTINDTQNAGTLYTLPTIEASEGNIFLGWLIDGVFYAAGSQYQLPSETCTVTLVAREVAADTHVYIDPVNGVDGNVGFSAETAVQTVAAAEKLLAVFPETATLHVVGTWDVGEGSISLPAYAGTLVVTGKDTEGVIAYGEGLTMNSDVVFENIGIKANKLYKQIATTSHNFTFGSGSYTVEGSEPISIHAGNQNADVNADMSIVVNSANMSITSIMVGPFYMPTGQDSRVWNGNANIQILSGSVSGVSYGDGYTNVTGKFVHNGSVNIFVADGAALGAINSANYNLSNSETVTGTSGEFVVYNYGRKAISIADDQYNEGDNTYVFNFTGVTTGTLVDGVLNVDGTAYVVETCTNAVEGAIAVVPGVNTVKDGVCVAADGLTIAGAQIRLETEDALQGLRFIADFSDALAAEYEGCEYGFVVIPASVVGNEAVVVDGIYGDYAAATVVAERIYEDRGDSVWYTACMTDLAADQYKMVYTAVPYIKVAEGEYVYGEQYSTSVYAVANKALEDDTLSEDVIAQILAIIDAAA